MTLAASRIVVQGETPYAHERAAIDFAISVLPSHDPYHLWALTELLDPSSGRLHEIDLLVLGYSTLFLIEAKSGPGLYTGDSQDWYRTAPGEARPRYLENPNRLTNLKAKILASRLRAKMTDPKLMPFVQPLVFLSAPVSELQLRFNNYGDLGVVTRDTFFDAMKLGRFPGSDGRQRPRINEPTMRQVAAAMAAIGLKPRRGKAHVGAYELAGVLGEGPGFQDRLARHRDNPAIARRARIYAVPQASSVERRQQLRRAADRDAQLLFELREHPSILRFIDYVVDAELGPTVLFDQLDGAMPLDAFLRHDNPGFYDRVTLVEHIARALAHCHKKGIIHGALSPEAVLVRRQPAVSGASGAPGALDVRVFNFQLGFGPEVEATTHWSALGSEPWAVYQAPELREDANNRRPVSDMFSLGALAYLIFTGRAPGATAADVDQHLARHRTLDPRAVDDSIDEKVGDLVANITDRSPINRIDDPDEWIELLLSEVTRPTDNPTSGDALNPLDAKPGDALGDELLIVEVGKDRPILGQGATSRVLLVARVSDGRSYALKVSLSAEHDERLEDEARELERLRHPRIVQLVQRYSFAGRPSLLLSLAGIDTLHRLLAREGTVSLERAARYGEDLLSAVDYLEEHKILHRDIKPANVGVGSVSNKAHHLTLFDFSLASAPLTELQVGTAAYRDPFLRQRGVWDAAAERWSTAVTLHEMVTGIRPSFDRPVVDPDAALVIAVERIDPSVRANLAAFFERSLHKDAGLRFESADAMRRAWLRAFESPAIAGQVATEREPQVATTADLAALGPETPMEALPLSPRARNALDRAGFLTAGDLHGLADNRLSAIRGIGSNVAKEIHEFKDRWAKAHADAARPAPFFPSYRGEDTAIAATALGAPGALGAIDARAQAALLDAGLTTLAAVAESPAPQIRALAHRFGFDERALNELLGRENTSANERARPSTIAGWVEALLPKKKSLAHIRELYGLDGPLAGQLGIQVRALADAIGMTTAGIYLALGKARETWSKHGALPELQSLAHTIVAQAGGVSPLDGAGRALLGVIHHGFTGSGAKGTDSSDSSAGSGGSGEARDDAALVAATSLLRVVAEVEKDEDGGLRTLRVDDRGLWLCASEAHGRALRVLGDAADALAARPIVPGQSEAQRAFAEAVADTPLAALPLERLADIAAAASATAARSARLEIYPRGMEPERALTLSASQLRSNLEPAEIVRRVSLRYPAAQPLPDRPALDALLAVHGLVFDAPRGQYVRAGENEPTIMSSRLPTLTERFTTALPSQSLSMDPEAVQAREFDALLRNAAERRELRVLGVRPDRARSAALALASRLGTQPIAFDQRLVAAIRVEMERAGIAQDEVVHAADRAGRTGSAWRNLVKLATLAGNALMDELLITNQVLLLTQLGLIGRYRLDGLVEKLLAGRRPAPVFMLVPSHDTGAIPTIQSPGGDYPIPGLLRSQVLWVPLEWLDNHHNRPAEPGLGQKAG